MKNKILNMVLISAMAIVWLTLPVNAMADRTIVDAAKRSVNLPEKIDRIICSGPGALRLITYFKAENLVVAVDDIEIRKKKYDARPYSLAYTKYRDLPVFGGFRGHDDPEKILGLEKQPQVIFKTYATMGYDPVELQAKTQIPVVTLEYGDLAQGRKKLFDTLIIIGTVLNKQDRAEELINFFSSEIEQLEVRTKDIKNPKTCFVGGIAFKGPHGFQSTEPSYPPFQFINAKNIAAQDKDAKTHIRHSNFSKEKILMTDPDVLFLDLSTLQLGDGQGGLHELKTDPVFQALTSVTKGRVYGVLPYNWYTQNFSSILADAWYIGKVLYPERFKDIDPFKKADQVYTFLVSAPVFKEMNSRFQNMAFKPVKLSE